MRSVVLRSGFSLVASCHNKHFGRHKHDVCAAAPKARHDVGQLRAACTNTMFVPLPQKPDTMSGN